MEQIKETIERLKADGWVERTTNWFEKDLVKIKFIPYLMLCDPPKKGFNVEITACDEKSIEILNLLLPKPDINVEHNDY